MDFVSILGYVAGFLTTVAYAPQFLRAYNTKSTKDISLAMLLTLTFGVILWLIYGVLINDGALIAANAITFLLSFGILVLKIKHG